MTPWLEKAFPTRSRTFSRSWIRPVIQNNVRPREADPHPDFDFRAELTRVTPHLRAFARGLCGRADFADDLVQEALLRAWTAREKFQPGTSMKNWTFVILRNVYLSEVRRNRFHGEYDPDAAERLLSRPGDQEGGIHMGDLKSAMMRLPLERREALLLVGAGGLSYEEAANIVQCAVGTMKSRVSRGRRHLEAILEGTEGRKEGSTPTFVSHEEILEDMDKVVDLMSSRDKT
ncbi:MAG: sigma-70 family RNA polymerase sigma factor [Sphingobium sp.]|nr:sigma-70 family RNA polymerase sigma factor [Sphingobium sp.]